MSGFITIERRLWDHPMFAVAPMTEREAWMWMIASAAWADTTHRVGQEVVQVARGSFVTTLRDLQSTFMWGSDKRVRTFLKMLEKNGMVSSESVGKTNARKTRVTICNYNEYQSRGRATDAPRTHDGRTTDAVKEQDKQKNKDTALSADEGFAKFWDAYPHRNGQKKNRKGAEAKFIKVVKSGVPAEQIMAGVKAMMSDPDVKRGYARDVVTWLNQEGWADERKAGSRPSLTVIPRAPGISQEFEMVLRGYGM